MAQCPVPAEPNTDDYYDFDQYAVQAEIDRLIENGIMHFNDDCDVEESVEDWRQWCFNYLEERAKARRAR